MSAEKQYTEREVVLREREASARARCAALWSQPQAIPHGAWVEGGCAECRAKAAERHPLPKVVRPRFVKDPHGDAAVYRAGGCGGGTLRVQWRDADRPSGIWRDWPQQDPWGLLVTRERLAVWADLLANPVEEVEDDGPAPSQHSGSDET